jgi:hypothetical protein
VLNFIVNQTKCIGTYEKDDIKGQELNEDATPPKRKSSTISAPTPGGIKPPKSIQKQKDNQEKEKQKEKEKEKDKDKQKQKEKQKEKEKEKKKEKSGQEKEDHQVFSFFIQ